MKKVYIGLGSNLNNPLMQIKSALKCIKEYSQLTLISSSSFYQSKAMIIENTPAQPDYINAVVEIKTSLKADELLIIMHQIETLQGRVRTEKWCARTLDLDILLYDDKIINNGKLIIPHPEMLKRNFVICPLYELNPNLSIPGKGELKDYYDRISKQAITKLA